MSDFISCTPFEKGPISCGKCYDQVTLGLCAAYLCSELQVEKEDRSLQVELR